MKLNFDERECLLRLINANIDRLAANVKYLISQGKTSKHRLRYQKELEHMRSIRDKIVNDIES